MAKSDKLFVTEAECAERIGITTEQFKAALHTATQEGFPAKDPSFANRRYWPAVKAWLDRRYGLVDQTRGITGYPGLDGEENWPKAISASRRRS